ncbi:hypothetical protein KC19_10G084400 [Ceratodon purpureus]|uniref:Uncharacterized protein n=1 Tax=Ceratodon purpureus TaxID=3225 RepID=A0A8T0GLQ1_CERPU|nr:hypothetical protein KC19_10G084400 [Ceratodon purpureus]
MSLRLDKSKNTTLFSEVLRLVYEDSRLKQFQGPLTPTNFLTVLFLLAGIFRITHSVGSFAIYPKHYTSTR